MKMNKWSWMLLGALSLVSASDKIEGELPFKPSLNFRLQPIMELDSDNKEFAEMADSASIKSDIKRAKLGVKLSPLKGDYVGAVLSFDFAKTNILRNAYVDFKWHKAAKLKVGRYKMPFGLDFQKGGSDYYRIYSSKGSDYIEDLVTESRQLGFGFRGKVKFSSKQSISYNLNRFESNNVFTPGLNLFELNVGDLSYKMDKFKVGVSWLSELIERSSAQGYRAHLWSLYSSFAPKFGLFEVEAIIGDDAISKYHTSLGDTLDFSVRKLSMIKWKVGDSFKMNSSLEYEFLKYSSYEKQLVTLGLGVNGPKKNSPWGVSLNLRNEISDDENGETDFIWDEVGLLLNYSVKWK